MCCQRPTLLNGMLSATIDVARLHAEWDAAHPAGYD